MNLLSRVVAGGLLFALVPSSAVAADEKAETKGKTDRAALEKAFQKKLSGAALIGTFSIVGSDNDKPPRPERYEIEKVTKLKGRDDYWIFTARIKYGKNDYKAPITLKVLWAGDTPMISMTNVSIPGSGTFTARVMFYGDRYAGTWQHGKVGGHMWGVIEPPKTAKIDKTTE